jgi:regulator of replication initiation timing
MELFARLENIEFHIKQLKSKCVSLENANEQLLQENKSLRQELEIKTQALLNTEETNKISKLAESAGSSTDSSAFKIQIDQIIQEIEQCLILIKQ